MVTDWFTNAVAMGGNVLRTWGMIDIGSLDGTTVASIDGKKGSIYFQYWDTTANAPAYNDGATGLQNLDYVIYSAKNNGMKVILSLVNNWSQFGGMDQYATWYKLPYHDNFYTNANTQQAYKNYVSHLVNRVNTYTNVAYKNEPAILAWELTNELRCAGTGNLPSSTSCTTATTLAWVDTMSQYIRSIDPNHMISVGDEGFFNGRTGGWLYNGAQGTDFDGYLAKTAISFGTLHLYPSSWSQPDSWGNSWITDHLTSGTTANKPVIVEEFGIESTNISSRDTNYQVWVNTIQTQNSAGDCYWMLAGHDDSGNEVEDYDGYTLYNDGTTASNIMKAHAATLSAKSHC